MDVFGKARRSEIMSRVRSHGNRATELALVRLFYAHSINGWRRHRPVFGRPDFVFPRERVALFVDGCFWHSCPRHRTMPATNRFFWEQKLQRNRDRDLLVNKTLRGRGWSVLRIWQHELTRAGEAQLLKRLTRCLARAEARSRKHSQKARGDLTPVPNGD
jgi:DNA mismatch endonuclease, patch repair protein